MPNNDDQPSGIPERGFWLNFSPDATAVHHDFCGQPMIAGALCPNCDKPLLRILSLSAKDPALALDQAKTPIIHLLYCWTCSIPYGAFSYRIKQDAGVELIQVPEPMPEIQFGPEGPYEGYTGDFALSQVSLIPQSITESEKLKARWAANTEDTDDSLFEPRHQIGGYPFIYNPSKLNCPTCNLEMRLLACICNDATGNNPWRREAADTFVDNGGVQMVFQFCSNCSVVSAAHSCD